MNDAFAALGEPRRREILNVLSGCELPASAIVDAIQANEAISQPAVSQHLKVLREAGLIDMRAEGTRRIYSVNQDGIAGIVNWLSAINDPRTVFDQPLDALATEVARGKRRRPPSHHADETRSA